jgi:hypothetical protein
MYNEEMKVRFILGYTKGQSTIKLAHNVFKAIEPFEEDVWEADVCTRSAKELQPVVDQILGLRKRSASWILAILRAYAKWCILSKYPGACDGIMHVETLGLDKVRRQMVSSPLHLQKYFDEVFDKESEETIDNIYRCFLWMGYSGMSEEDAMCVKATSVDMAALKITSGDSEFPIYREAIQAFKNAVELTSFLYKNPNYKEKKHIRRNRIEGDMIMRRVTAGTHLMTVRSTLSKRLTAAQKNGQTEQKLSFYRAWLSGLFYRMAERERAGIPADFGEIVAREMEQKPSPVTGGLSTQAKQNERAKDYLEDYQRWKLAFFI